MAREIRSIRAAALEALGSFRLYEFAPLAWILVAELAFLSLAMNLGAAWGMSTAGSLSAALGGEGVLHYPDFYAFLPNLMSDVDAALYVLAGSVLIPLLILRVLQPIDPASFPPGSTGARVRQAILPVLAGTILWVLLTLGWQWVLSQPAVMKGLRAVFRGGFVGAAGITAVSLVVGYAIWSLFVYIPAVAVQPGRGFGSSLVGGLREGLSNFFPTLLVVIGLQLPAAAILFVLQVMGAFLVRQIQPEIIGVLIGLGAVLSILATYFIYSAAARYYQARHGEVA
ncbi:MAG: hypothetical protein ACM3PF_10840 [Bacteroidota bacterium]